MRKGHRVIWDAIGKLRRAATAHLKKLNKVDKEIAAIKKDGEELWRAVDRIGGVVEKVWDVVVEADKGVVSRREDELWRPAMQRDTKAVWEAIESLLVHYPNIVNAINIAKEHAWLDAPDAADRKYWERELAALDSIYAIFSAARRLCGELPKAGHWDVELGRPADSKKTATP